MPAVDFIRDFSHAEQRPAGAFEAADHLVAGTRHRAILAPAPGRLTWTLPIPRRATFRAVVAPASNAPARVRVGVSDARIYEALAAVDVQPGSGWTPVTANLSDYAGWKISLFYRPERQAWHVNVSIDAIGGVAARVALGSPEIVTDRDSAAEYAKRRARITRSEAP